MALCLAQLYMVTKPESADISFKYIQYTAVKYTKLESNSLILVNHHSQSTSGDNQYMYGK